MLSPELPSVRDAGSKNRDDPCRGGSRVQELVVALASFAAVALVCLARLDGVFTFRDLTWADTAIYYRNTSRWLGHGLLTVDRAPLYVLLLSGARRVIDDATIVVPAFRLIAALALALAGLAFFRRLFPAAIALVLATWAAVVPTQFDGLYEIHLIGAAACAVAAWAATYGERRWPRALVLGMLLVFSLLRSEFLAAAFAWGAACAFHEWTLRSASAARAPLAPLLLPYLLPPLALLLLISATFASGTWVPRFSPTAKTTRHFCNAYAMGVAEREGLPVHATWRACKSILRRDFGRTDVGPLKALAASPRAVLSHFAWNLRLLPATLERMLWGATGARQGADYEPVRTGSRPARTASLVLAALVLAGLLRRRPPRDPDRVAQRRWGLVGLGALLATSVGILLFSRARAAYLAPVGLATFVLVGRALEGLWPTASSRRAELVIVGLVLCAAPLLPSRYDAAYATPRVGRGQPTATAVRRLNPTRDVLASDSVRLAWSLRPRDLCYYLSSRTGFCDGVRLRAPLDDPRILDRELRRLGATHVYVDEWTPGRAAERLEGAELGWKRIAPADRSAPWVLLRAEPRSERGRTPDFSSRPLA